jgi:hypothetical protein
MGLKKIGFLVGVGLSFGGSGLPCAYASGGKGVLPVDRTVLAGMGDREGTYLAGPAEFRVSSQSGSVNFVLSGATIVPSSNPNLSGTIIVDQSHSINLRCGMLNRGTGQFTLQPTCQMDGQGLVLDSYSGSALLEYRAFLTFNPPITSGVMIPRWTNFQTGYFVTKVNGVSRDSDFYPDPSEMVYPFTAGSFGADGIFSFDAALGGTYYSHPWTVSANLQSVTWGAEEEEIDLVIDPLQSQGRCPAGTKLDSSKTKTVQAKGCAVTSLSMALNYAGLSGDVCSLNSTLANQDGVVDERPLNFDDNANINWMNAVSNASDKSLKFKYFKSSSTEAIKAALEEGYPVIVGVNINAKGQPGHFVVVNGTDGSDFKIVDPNGGQPGRLSDYGNFQTRGQVVPAGNLRLASMTGLSQLSVSVEDRSEVLLTDSVGRRVGFDRTSGSEINEVPGATYFSDVLDDDELNVPGTDGSRFLYLPNPTDNFRIDLIGRENGPYRMVIDRYGSDGSPQEPFIVAGNGRVGELVSFSVSGDAIAPAGDLSIKNDYLKLEPNKATYIPGDHAFLKVSQTKQPTNSDFRLSLEATFGGQVVKLNPVGKTVSSFRSDSLQEGVHFFEVRVVLENGAIVDAATKRVSELQKEVTELSQTLDQTSNPEARAAIQAQIDLKNKQVGELQYQIAAAKIESGFARLPIVVQNP